MVMATNAKTVVVTAILWEKNNFAVKPAAILKNAINSRIMARFVGGNDDTMKAEIRTKMAIGNSFFAKTPLASVIVIDYNLKPW